MTVSENVCEEERIMTNTRTERVCTEKEQRALEEFDRFLTKVLQRIDRAELDAILEEFAAQHR